MKRWKSTIGLLLSLSALQQANRPDSELAYPAFWSDLGLLGAIVFLVLLIIGPGRLPFGSRGNRESAAHPPEQEERGEGSPGE